MNQQIKKLNEKMVDFKRFAMVLLAVSVFFYLGVIIPTEKSPMDLNMMIIASSSFLAVSLLFFIKSKQCQLKLLEMEDGQGRE